MEKFALAAVVFIAAAIMIFSVVLSLRSEKGWFFAGISTGGIYFLIVPTLIYLLQGYTEVGDENAGSSYAYVDSSTRSLYTFLLIYVLAIFFHFAILCCQLLTRADKRHPALPDATKRWARCRLSMLALLCSYVAFYFLALADASHWYLAKADFFYRHGQFGVLFGFAIFSLKIVFLTDVFSLYGKRFISSAQAVLTLVTVLSLELLITGNRIAILLAAILCVLSLIERREYKKIFVMGVLALSGAFLLAGYGVFRSLLFGYGFEYALEAFLEQLSRVEDHFAFLSRSLFETVNLNVLFSITSLYPPFDVSTDRLTLLKPFFFIIPRSLYADKVEAITVLVGNELDGRLGLSLVTLAYGEGYYNFGVLYPLLLALYFFAVYKVLNLFAKRLDNKYLSFFIGFLIMRFPVSDVVVQLGVAVAIAFIADALIKVSYGRKVTFVRRNNTVNKAFAR